MFGMGGDPYPPTTREAYPAILTPYPHTRTSPSLPYHRWLVSHEVQTHLASKGLDLGTCTSVPTLECAVGACETAWNHVR